MILRNAKIVTETEIIKQGYIVIEDNLIKTIKEGTTLEEGIDLKGKTIIPGFIECHVHGGYGHDFESGSIESFSIFAKKAASEGVTKFCQGPVTNSYDDMIRLMKVYREYMQNHNTGAKARQIGAHMEGPFISKEYKGAHEEKLLKKPDIKMMKDFIEASGYNIRIVSFAPEQQNGEFIKFLKTNNILPSLGHTAASFEQINQAVKNGANHVTHLYNGMSKYDHRNPGAVAASLYFDQLMVELITDGIHVDKDIVALTYKLKTANNICIITDAMNAKGLEDGNYKLGSLDVVKQADTIRLKQSNNLAGSALRYDNAFKNAIKFMNCSLQEAVLMSSTNIAKQLNIYDKTGSISEGKLADITIIDDDYNIYMTICEGEIAYQAN